VASAGPITTYYNIKNHIKQYGVSVCANMGVLTIASYLPRVFDERRYEKRLVATSVTSGHRVLAQSTAAR